MSGLLLGMIFNGQKNQNRVSCILMNTVETSGKADFQSFFTAKICAGAFF